MGVEIRASSRYLDEGDEADRRGAGRPVDAPGLEGEQEHPYEGQCYFIDNAIDETTSTFLIKARVPNPKGTLLPGEYVRLRMVVDRLEDAVVVPETGVMETETGPVVYVVDGEGKVAIQRVERGPVVEGLRIITSGLEAGVPVIVQGLQLIRPGIAGQVRAGDPPEVGRCRGRGDHRRDQGSRREGVRTRPGMPTTFRTPLGRAATKKE